MTETFEDPSDATTLNPDERTGLLKSWIATRAELNLAEQNNIESGAIWARQAEFPDLLTVKFVTSLHKRMFGEVWSWAGKFRRTEKNIGVAPNLIGSYTGMLLDDARFGVEHQTYQPTELAVRLHHRLVYVHPFSNGNGRHARLLANLVLRRLGESHLSWGLNSQEDINTLRRAYIQALRRADQEDYEALIEFARS